MKIGTRYSANRFWEDVLFHDHEHGNITPLVGPKFLWDARLPNTLTLSGNLVTSWFDLYQNTQLDQFFGEDLSKAPTYEVLGGSPTISFNGINNYLAAYPINESSLNFTILVVVSGLQVNLADNPGQILFLFNNNTGSASIQFINVMDQIGITSDSTDLGVFLSGPIQVIALRVSGNGTLIEAFLNGGTPSSGSAVFTGGINFLQIGSQLGNNYLAGDVPWIAYYDTALSNSDLNAALTYAGESFSIPITPVS